MFGDLDLGFVFDVFNFLKVPTGVEPRYMAGQHYWEVGMRGYRVRNLSARFSEFFSVLQHYRNKDWLPSHNFVLKSRHAGGDHPR